ncbi:MAG: AsmA family protein, partial [Desulfatitalea sp.]|nr:AsmA family protein [Desulfatitalea sp.]NNK00332.1 AsmA family protein [Desulfatitalea sp.]
MPKVLKWILGILVVCGVMVITAMLLAPVFFNLEKMKPRIEAEAAKVIGRPLTLGGKIEPSVFPWVGISLADVHLGNPEGFSQKDFVALGLFEVRVKLLPLLSGQVVIKRFVVKEPRIVLETTKAGRSNLEGLGSPKADQPPASPAPFPPDLKTGDGGGLPIKSLKAEEFAVVGGHVLMIDQAAGTRQVIDAINLTLTNLS